MQHLFISLSNFRPHLPNFGRKHPDTYRLLFQHSSAEKMYMFTPLKLPTYTKYAGQNENCVYFDTSVLPSHFEIDKGHLWCVCLCEEMLYLDTGVHHFAAQNIFTFPLKLSLSRKAA